MSSSPASVQQLIESGIAAEARGDALAAERLYRRAIAAAPESASARMNLGIVLHGSGDAAGAAEQHALAAKLDPGSALAHYNLALARLDLGELAAAESGFREALKFRPEFPEALVALADALETNGRDLEALELLQSAVSQRPDYVGAIFNAGILLRKLGRLDEAVAYLQKVPFEHLDSANARTALAAILRDQGRIEESVAIMRAALESNPDSGVAACELLFTQGFSDALSAEALFAEHLWAGCRAEYEVKPWCISFPNSKDPARTLKVGYLSGDFCGHSVSLFTEFLFERHHPERVIAYAYSSTGQQDAITARIKSAAHGWRDLHGRPDEEVAKSILADGIDILVDLAGHTGFQRIGVLAGRAAPIQMTWLGYIHSTGLTRIDYRITDAISDPQGIAEALHTESLLRMPNAQWCFRPPQAARDARCSREVSDDAFTFGSFNQFPKVSDSSIALWAGALRAAPEAKLRIVGVPRGSASETVGRKLTAAGIPRNRFDLVERVPLANYYSQYNQVDACLDTTPYSGGTTTCDALWMGVPVITLTGKRSMSRSSASLLAAVGLGDLVAHSPEAFAAIACRLAASGRLPDSSRNGLRNRMRSSPLMDEVGFTKDLEGLYRVAWKKWCEGRPAHD